LAVLEACELHLREKCKDREILIFHGGSMIANGLSTDVNYVHVMNKKFFSSKSQP
jgi:hypothetical protein